MTYTSINPDVKSYTYAICDTINDKIYIGKTNNPSKRWIQHKRIAIGGKNKHPSFSPIHKAMIECGIENFLFEILEEHDSEVEAFKAEVYWILLFGTTNSQYGYNCNAGGNGGYGMIDDIRAKISIANKGHQVSSETREKISKANLGRIILPETRVKISVALTGKEVSQETRIKLSVANKGRVHSEKSKTNMSIAQLGKKQSPETVEKRVSQLRGRERTPEVKAKIGAANKGRIVSQEIRDKQSIDRKGRIPWNKGVPMSDEQKLKLSTIKPLSDEQIEKIIKDPRSFTDIAIEYGVSITTISRIKRKANSLA